LPKYKIQLKQGSKTYVQYGEFKSVDSCLLFYSTLSTAKVTEILRVEYENDTLPPVDDLQYFPIYKGFVRVSETRKSKQIIINHVKLSKNEGDIARLAVECCEVDGVAVDAVVTSLLKSPMS